MKIFNLLINFILKFLELISYLFKLRADQSQIPAQPSPTTDVGSGNEPGDRACQLQPLANAAEGRHTNIDVEASLVQSEATASSGEHSNLARRVQLQANAAGAPEEYRREPSHTTTRGRQPPNDDVRLQWRLLIFGIYLTAVGIVLQALQTMEDVPVHKSFQFHSFRMALVFSVAYLTVSVYVRRYFEAAALIFEHVAVFFGAMAFVLVITVVDFPPPVLIVSLVVFVVSLLIVFLATYLRG